MKIRLYQRKDFDSILKIYYDSIHQLNKDDYDEEALDAMAPVKYNEYHWQTQLEKNHTLVAVDENDKVLGFGNIGQTGFLDRLYVSPQATRQKIATQLVEKLENYASAKGIKRIDTISTITSLPFFESLGYKQIEEQANEKHGVRIIQYIMEKTL